MGTEELYGGGVKLNGDLVGAAELQYVWLWDLGPTKPVSPKRPIAPKKAADHKGEWKEGDPEYDLVKLEFDEVLAEYQAAREQFKRELKEHAEWTKKYGGPFEIRFFSCDAHDALDRAKDRYCISSRTRGHERLKNGGLPEGVKPGRAQAENLRRMEEGEADLAEARRRDPVFGEEVRP